jgi:DNA-binding GntR family transcriptional regulator
MHLRQAVRAVPSSYFELFPAQERRSRREHAALLSAMECGDAAEARALAEAHVLDAGAALSDWLRVQHARTDEGAESQATPDAAPLS